MSREWSERHIRDIIRNVYNENFNGGYIDRLNKMLNANAHTVFYSGTYSGTFASRSDIFKPVKVEYYIDKAEIREDSSSNGYITYYPFFDFHGKVTFMESPFRKENAIFDLGWFPRFLKFETDLGPILPIGGDVNARIGTSSLWSLLGGLTYKAVIPLPKEYGRIVLSSSISKTSFLYTSVSLSDYEYKSGLISSKGETVVPFKGRSNDIIGIRNGCTV